MGHVDVAGVRYELPDGRVLLDDVSFRVGDGAKVALVGANGAGKTTLLRIITGDLTPARRRRHPQRRPRGDAADGLRTGSATIPPWPTCCSRWRPPGSVARTPRSTGSSAPSWRTTTRRPSWSTPRRSPSTPTPAATTSRSRGTSARSPGSACPTTGPSTASCARSRAASRSGWCSSTCCAAPTRCCCSTSPTTSSTSPARSGWRQRIRESAKTILFISHDRELLDNTATRIVTVELGSAGNHGVDPPGRLRVATTRPARTASRGSRSCAAAGTRSTPSSRRWCCGYKIKAEYNDGMASQYQAAQTRLRKFEEAGPPTEQPREQQVTMRLKGGRTGKRAVVCEQLELTGSDAAVRPRGLVRRAGGRARLQRLRQVPLPAAAGRRRLRPRHRAPAGRRGAGEAGRPHRPGQARRPRAARAGSCRPTSTPS